MVHCNSLPQKTILSLALAAALASMVPLKAQAACNAGGTISTSVSGTQPWGAGDCTITSGGTISGGTPALSTNANAGTLTNSGTIAGGEIGLRVGSSVTVTSVLNNGRISAASSSGLQNNGTIGTLTNSGTIFASYYGINNAGSIGMLINDSNSGIHGANFGIYNGINRNISSLSNSGTISGVTGLYSGGTIGTLTNSGVITGSTTGLLNVGAINSLVNAGVIFGNVAAGIYNGGTLSTLTNSGTISGATYGVQSDNDSSIVSLYNTSMGTILGKTAVLIGNLSPSGTINIGTLTNDGLISGATNVGVGTSVNGAIGTLVNTGTILGVAGGVGNAGSIGPLINSGTISSGGYAVYNASTGTIGPITNSGLIAGVIMNLSSRDMTINGASGSSFGTLTGSSAGIGNADRGTITNSSSNLIFSSGNLLLNNHINVTGHTVSNTGATLQFNNPVTITGNYTQSSGAILQIGVANGATATGTIGSDSGYGRLVVNGNATIATGSSVGLQKLSSYAFAAGQRFVVIDATTATYNESTLNYSATGFSGTITGESVANGGRSDLVLTLSVPSSPSNPVVNTGPATTPNAVSSLAGLNHYTGISSLELLNLFNASQALSSTSEANRAGAQLSPTSQASTSKAAAAPMLDVLNIVAAHSDSLRLARFGGISGISTGERAPDVGVWGQAFGGHASQDERNQIDGYGADYGGLLLGIDKQVSDQWSLGGALSYSNASIDSRGNTSGNSSDVDSYGLLGYGSYTGKPWYINFSVGAVWQSYDTKRAISLPGFSGEAHGNFDGMQYVAKAEAGYPLTTGSITTTPLLGLTYSHLKQDAYTESGGNGAALSIGSATSKSVQSDLGIKFERGFATSYGNLVPSLKLAWRHEYENKRLSTNASFAADPIGETSFSTLGASPIKDSGLVTLGATLLKSNNMSLVVRYELQTASGFTSQGGSIRWRKLF